MEKSSLAAVLRVSDVNENDGYVNLLFDDGRIMSLIALGIQKSSSKNRLALQIFSIVEVEFFQSRNKNKGKLKRATLVEQTIPDSLSKYNQLLSLAETILKLTKVPKEVFMIWRELIHNIKFGVSNLSLIFYCFVILLKGMNINPNLENCVHCGKNELIASFSLPDGGLICKYHLQKKSQTQQKGFLQKIIYLFRAENLKEAQKIMWTVDEEIKLKDMFKNYFIYSLGLNADLLNKI